MPDYDIIQENLEFQQEQSDEMQSEGFTSNSELSSSESFEQSSRSSESDNLFEFNDEEKNMM